MLAPSNIRLNGGRIMQNETKTNLTDLEAVLKAEYPFVWKELKGKTYEKKKQVVETHIKVYTKMLNEDEETLKKEAPPCYVRDDEALKEAISFLTELKEIYQKKTSPEIMEFTVIKEPEKQAELEKAEKQFAVEHKEAWDTIKDKPYKERVRIVYGMSRTYLEVAMELNDNIKKSKGEDLHMLIAKMAIAAKLCSSCKKLSDLYFEKVSEERTEFLLNETNSQILERGADFTERFLSIGISIETINGLVESMNKDNFEDVKEMLLGLCDRTRTKSQSLRDVLLAEKELEEN